jgi:PAS domain S-box-containing protein
MVSGTALFFGLFNNLAIFIVLIAVYSALNSYLENSGRQIRQLAMGIAFGFFAIACMHVKIPVAEGVIVDQRNAIVALSGAFGGPLSAMLCAAMTASYRIHLGGAGALAGVAGVSLAALAGMGLYAWRAKMDSPLKAATGALAATLVILPGFLLVGDFQTGWGLMKAMALPYGVAIFLGIFLVGILIAHEEHRRTAQVELNNSEKRYRELFENLIDVSYRTDVDGNFVVISPSSKTLFGYTPEEVLGRQIANFYREPATREKFLDRLRRDGRIENFEAEIRKKDGTFVWVSTNAKLLTDAEGDFSGVEGVTRDISRVKSAEKDKRILEDRLWHSQKMEAIGTLAGGVAHDFNNILTAIIGYTELVIDHLPDGSQDRDHLGAVLSAANRAKELTHQILTFSRKGKTDKTIMKIHPIIEEAVNLLKQTIPSTVKIKADLDPGAGIVLADSTQIHQVALNLCTNAFHSFEDEKGEIDIELKPVDVDTDTDARHQNLRKGRYARLTVRDNGKGIDPVTMPRIFEPFFTTKGRGKGTGLGLSVVHGIVENHRGAIVFESELNQGSMFQVFFPLLTIENQPASAEKFRPRHGTENILLIDDEPSLVDLGKRMLENLGYNVLATQSADDALERLTANPGAFDLIITDQTMPDIPGDVLAKKVFRIRPELPVIICTGYSAVLNPEKALASGVRAVLMKPLDRRELSEAVRRVLDEPVQARTERSDQTH